MRTLSLAHFTVISARPEELVPITHKAGFDTFGLRIVPPLPTDTVIPVIGEKAVQRQIRQQIDDSGVKLLDIEAFWLMPHTNVDAWRSALEVGAYLGASHALLVGNDPEHARQIENLGRFCEISAEYNIRPMLEFIPYAQIGTLKQAHDALVEANAQNAGILVDTLHLSRSGGHPDDLAGVDPAMLDYVHICDAPKQIPSRENLRPEARGQRLYPGEGELWLEDFLRNIPANAIAAVEAPSAKHAELSLQDQASLARKMLASLVDRVDG